MVAGAQKDVGMVVASWEGVREGRNEFRLPTYYLGKRELGHIHGDEMVDIPFTRQLRDEIIADGRARPHHVHPEIGWISLYLTKDTGVPEAVSLFELSYQAALRQEKKMADANLQKNRA